MKRLGFYLSVVLALLLPASVARAGVYTDEMSKCLVSSTSADDKTVLMTWVFASMSVHPAIKAYSQITPAEHEVISKAAGNLMQRLLVTDCRKETAAALQYEGASAIEASFSVLGQVAMRGLMTNPDVAGQFSGLAKYLDVDKIKALGDVLGHSDAAAPAHK